MGFLDDLKDKAEEFGGKTREGLGAAKDRASDLIGDVRDRLDQDDETSEDKDEATVDQSAGAVNHESRGLDEAVAESTAAGEGSGTETAADAVGDVGPAPVADPLEPGDRVADAVDAPAGGTSGEITEDPLDPRLEAVDPIVEPAGPTDRADDPLEAPPDRTV